MKTGEHGSFFFYSHNNSGYNPRNHFILLSPASLTVEPLYPSKKQRIRWDKGSLTMSMFPITAKSLRRRPKCRDNTIRLYYLPSAFCLQVEPFGIRLKLSFAAYPASKNRTKRLFIISSEQRDNGYFIRRCHSMFYFPKYQFDKTSFVRFIA